MEPQEQADAPLEPGVGLLELHPNGYGFLRSPTNNYSRERTDPFVPGTMIEKYSLRPGRDDQRNGPASAETARSAIA